MILNFNLKINGSKSTNYFLPTAEKSQKRSGKGVLAIQRTRVETETVSRCYPGVTKIVLGSLGQYDAPFLREAYLCTKAANTLPAILGKHWLSKYTASSWRPNSAFGDAKATLFSSANGSTSTGPGCLLMAKFILHLLCPFFHFSVVCFNQNMKSRILSFSGKKIRAILHCQPRMILFKSSSR